MSTTMVRDYRLGLAGDYQGSPLTTVNETVDYNKEVSKQRHKGVIPHRTTKTMLKFWIYYYITPLSQCKQMRVCVCVYIYVCVCMRVCLCVSVCVCRRDIRGSLQAGERRISPGG